MTKPRVDHLSEIRILHSMLNSTHRTLTEEEVKEPSKQPKPFSSARDSSAFVMDSRQAVMDKDEAELELEKLVFGDEVGFREGLKSYRYGDDASNSSEHSEEDQQGHDDGIFREGEDLEAIDDADLFFLDSGPSMNQTHNSTVLPIPKEDTTEKGDSPAWVDSDDERITVSLASNPRLRKLRHTEDEDLVNGREYSKRLRQQFERLYPVPQWANPSASKKSSSRRKRQRTSESEGSSASEQSADEMSIDSDSLSAQPLAKLLQDASSFTSNSPTTRSKLRPETIDIQRTKDVGGAQPSAITSLSFHPTHPLLLSSGPSSTLSLYHISPYPPHPNPLIMALHLRSTPLTTTLFAPPTGAKIFFSARRRYFHIWDLSSGKIEKVSRVYGHADEQRSMERFKMSPCGKWMALVGSARKGGGVVNILDAGTCQWVAQVRVEGKGGVADFEWWADGSGLVLLGKSGEAVEWSVRERRVLVRWVDDGALGTAVIALGGRIGVASADERALGGDRWIAVGSQSGIVNIYDRSAWGAKEVPERPTPTRTFKQLVTPTSHLTFSPDGQLLVMASRWKRDALRLIHLPSCTVYKNFPTANTPLGRISAIAITPNSEMLAVANEQGKIRLWEIRK